MASHAVQTGLRRQTPRWLSALLLGLVLFPWASSRPCRGSEPPAFAAEDLEFFEKEVRPILVARCYECHGSKKASRGGLRVDSRAALLVGGATGPAIVPGDPKNSLLIDAINYGDVYQMPPKTRMPASEVAILTKWVERGAPWPSEKIEQLASSDGFDLGARKAAHWCWQPIEQQSPPTVTNIAWPRKLLDHFVLAKLEAAGIQPAPQADKATLVRRVYFDLIGLPPSPDEVRQFLADNSPQAFERVVDKLLDSPHFGERWARHWMDVVRYAETCGHEFDYPIHQAWRYRDYLIRAFNADVPYDRFVLEHIAGDLLPRPRLNPTEQFNESILGTGFWFLHEASHAPVDARGDQALRIDNQIDVFSKAFLGLTVACARCHDHKFDAIATQDYYAIAGFLQSSRRDNAMLDPGGKIHQTSSAIARECEKVDREFQNAAASAGKLTNEQFAKWLLAASEVVQGRPKSAGTANQSPPPRGTNEVAEEYQLDPLRLDNWVKALADPALAETSHPLHAWQELAQSVSSKDSPTDDELNQWRERQRRISDQVAQAEASYPRFEDFNRADYRPWFVEGEAFAARPTASGRWDATASAIQLARPGVAHSGQLARNLRGVLRSPSFTINHKNIYYRLAGEGCEVRLIVDGYTMIEFHQLLFGGLKFNIDSKEKFVWHRQAGDLGMYLGHRAYIEVIDSGDGWAVIDEICFSDLDSPPPMAAATTLQVANSKQREDLSLSSLAKILGDYWQTATNHWREGTLDASETELLNWAMRNKVLNLAQSPESSNLPQAVEAARQQIAERLRNLPSPVMATAMTEGTGEDQPIYIRGNPRTPGELAPRQLLLALVGKQPPVERGSGRLILAQQIVDTDNPLTARVMVNRVWHHLFGRGIVASVDNFGVLGEKPTHPELLDFLAQRFMQERWSVKRLIRSLVLSSTYQMSSSANPLAIERDPTNQLWHSMPVRRLQAEAIRDAALTISGDLNDKLYGPSVAAYITPFMQGRGRPETSGPINGEGRRSIYVEVRRNFLSPLMLAFDAPIPFNSVGRRNVSNVPAQALILMNDPFFVEQARKWSQRLLAEKEMPFDERVERAYWMAFSRPPDASELERAQTFFATQSQALGVSNDQSRIDQHVWADYCHVLFNTKEFIFVR